MVIAGPNGVGKSTLLYAIKQKQGQVSITGKVLYLSAHRIWRRQQVHFMHLWDQPRKFSDLLSQDQIHGYSGINFYEGRRTPDSADESFSAVKHTLSQFETRKQVAVTTLLEREGEVKVSQVEDLYDPLREITQFLLPHLPFKGIDVTNRNNVRVLFKRRDSRQQTEVELDDLSSGERALISLFMPFLEEQIDQKLKRIEGAKADGPPQSELVILIDEPEIHLHPLLQARLLEYLRTISARGGTQFILTTHSPTLLDEADYDELFVLSPPTGDPEENQLAQLASSSDRLAALRLLSGETYSLTSGRRVLFVEGEPPSAASSGYTDARILELMCPQVSSYILIPFGSKSTTIQAASRLRELLPKAFGSDTVVALVDRDTSAERPESPWIHLLPVAMIENLLLRPAAIWSILLPQHERTGLTGPEDVLRALQKIAHERRDTEIQLRVERKLPLERIRVIGRQPEEILENLNHQTQSILQRFPSREDLQTIVSTATTEVDQILKDGRELSEFHGKEILRRFHHQYVQPTGIAHAAFVLQVARAIGSDPDLRKELQEALSPLLGTASLSGSS